MEENIPLALRERLQAKLKVTHRQVYRQIARIAREQLVSSRAAAFLLARDVGVSFSQFATSEDRAEMRGHSISSTPYSATQPQTHKAETERARRKANSRAVPTKDNSIFVVHGRDKKLTDDIFAFLRAIGLNPMEWNEAIKGARGGANPIVGDIINDAMKKVQGVMVLLSPDEQAKLKGKFVGERDKRNRLHILEGQPRPNVIFEAGLALGAHSAKTILVQVGEIRDISDIAGKHMAHLTNSPASRKALAQRLRDKLKFKINIAGDHWLEVGNFER